jgi:hypothetical protein
MTKQQEKNLNFEGEEIALYFSSWDARQWDSIHQEYSSKGFWAEAFMYLLYKVQGIHLILTGWTHSTYNANERATGYLFEGAKKEFEKEYERAPKILDISIPIQKKYSWEETKVFSNWVLKYGISKSQYWEEKYGKNGCYISAENKKTKILRDKVSFKWTGEGDNYIVKDGYYFNNETKCLIGIARGGGRGNGIKIIPLKTE